MPTSTYMHVCTCALCLIALVSCTTNVYTLMMSMNVCMCACQHNILYYVLTLMPTTLPLSPPNTYTHTHYTHTYTYIFAQTHTHIPTHYTPHRSRSRNMELSGYCWRGPSSMYWCLSNKDRQLKGSHVWGPRFTWSHC